MMKKLLALFTILRAWKISRVVTVFICICTFLAFASYMLSGQHNSPAVTASSSTMPQQATTPSRETGRGAGNVSNGRCSVSGCQQGPIRTAACSGICVTDVTDGADRISTSINLNWLSGNKNNPSGDCGNAPDVTNPGCNVNWLPQQGGRPWQWFFQTNLDPGQLHGNTSFTFTRQIWSVMVGVADMFVVVLFFMNAVKVIGTGISFRYREAIETLPKMFLVIVLANVSLIFVAFWVSLTNNLTQFIYMNITSYAGQHGLVPLYPDVSHLYITFGSGSFLWFGGSITQLDIFSMLDSTLPKFLAWGLLQLVMLQVLSRLIGLMLVTIFGGPMIMLGATPFKEGASAMRGWFMTVITTTLAQTVQVASLVIGGVLAASLYQTLNLQTAIQHFNNSQVGNNPPALDNNLVQPAGIALWIFVAVLWFTFKSAGLVRSSIANIGVEGVQSMSGQASGLAWAANSARFGYDQGWQQFKDGII